MLTSALRSGGLSTTSVAGGDAEQISWGKLNRLPCTVAESTLRVLDGYGLRGKLPARPALAPCIRFLFIDSHVCSMLPSDPASRRYPCIITRPYLHQVGQRTFTSKLLSMPSTQRSRSRGGRCRVDRHKRRNCPLEERMVPEVG